MTKSGRACTKKRQNTGRKSVEILSQVKQVLETDMEEMVNHFLASGEWILIDIRSCKYNRGKAYVLGLIGGS